MAGDKVSNHAHSPSSGGSADTNHTSNFRIFAAEDDVAFTKMLRYLLELDPEHDVKFFARGKDLLNGLHEKPSLITLDYSLPDINGAELLKKIRAVNSDIPIIVISGQEDISTAVQLLKLGAYDYICKDTELRERLLNSIHHVKRNEVLVTQIENLRQEVTQKYEFDKVIIGNSVAIRKVYSLLEKAAGSTITVSVTGETGTGKEVAAKAIHYNSNRRNKSFVAVNVAAIPSELLESELFGHEKGSFTGAATRRIGKFEEANQGTIFLDEIGEMPMHLQAKILRVLQEREVVRIGSNTAVKLDVRVIVATHRNLAEEVKAGNFRQDLYYRLLGLPILMPPLRERDNDVLVLARFFLDQFCKESRLPNLKISNAAAAKLKKYSWPGNVRELKAVVELAAVMASGDSVEPNDIIFNELSASEELLSEEMTLDDYTFRIIRHYLNKYAGNVIQVAEKLSIGKSTIYRYLKQMEEKGL
ncbi:MAG: sigma-54 dependent transcriptional regulator [Bacteroidota bacterium]